MASIFQWIYKQNERRKKKTDSFVIISRNVTFFVLVMEMMFIVATILSKTIT